MISNNNNMLSYVIRQEERLTPKERSLTADKERSWFEPIISDNIREDKEAIGARTEDSLDWVKWRTLVKSAATPVTPNTVGQA